MKYDNKRHLSPTPYRFVIMTFREPVVEHWGCMFDCDGGKDINSQDCQRLCLSLLVGKPSVALLSVAMEVVTAPIHDVVNDGINISALYDIVTRRSCPRRH